MIDTVSTKKLRNWWSKILDYELEEESEEDEPEPEKIEPETKQREPELIAKRNPPQRKQPKDQAPVTNKQPLHDEIAAEIEKRRMSKQESPKLKPEEKYNIETNLARAEKARQSPNKPPKVINNYQERSDELSVQKGKMKEDSYTSKKSTKTATKSKPFRIRDTPKKNSTVVKEKIEAPTETENIRASQDNIKPSKLNFGQEKAETKSYPSKQHHEAEKKPMMNTHNFERKQEKLVSNVEKKSDHDETRSQNNPKKSTNASSINANKPQIVNSSSQSSLGTLNGIIDLGHQNITLGEQKLEQMKSVSVPMKKKHETIKHESETVRPLILKVKSQTDDYERVGVKHKFDMNTIKPKTEKKQVLKTDLSDSPDSEEEKSVNLAQGLQIKKSQDEQSDNEEELEEEEEEMEESDEEEFPVALNGMVFSFIPQDTADKLNNEDWKKRTFAIQEIENLVKKQMKHPNEDFHIYIADILKKMCKLMLDSNFKISLAALRIIHLLWAKYPQEVLEWVSVLVNNLSDKIIIRHAVLKIFYSLVSSLGARKIVDLVYPYLTSNNWRIREEILNILIMSWLVSNSTWGLSDPKWLNTICQLVSDEKKKVSTAAFETLWWIFSKDSSTAIILNSYLDPQIYNLISERWISGNIATVNLEGIVEFPNSQSTNSNPLSYTSSYVHTQENESVQELEGPQKHTQSVDHTHTGNFQSSSNIGRIEDKNQYSMNTQPLLKPSNQKNANSSNKMWLPGFNMTASSIKSEQSVRVSQEPYNQTPNQFKHDIIDRRQERVKNTAFESMSNYTPEVHQNQPRTFGNMNNPSMTTHSMNSAPSQSNTMNNHTTNATRSNTFYSKGESSAYSYHENQNISDKLKILKSSSKMKNNHITRSPISQPDIYDDGMSSKGHSISNYKPSNVRKSQVDQYESKSALDNNEYAKSSQRPIKARDMQGVGVGNTRKTKTILQSVNDLENDSNDGKPFRYSQGSNKSLESRNRNKNSFHHKPPSKGKKLKGEVSERPLSIDARDDDSLSGKVMSPEQEWKQVLSDIKKKNNWEKQFKACNTIKDFSIEHPKFFSIHDPNFGEIMQELSNLCNSLRTQLSRNALGTFAIVFENLGKKADSVLDTVIPMLLKKAADTNAFIAEEAEKSLIKACEN